MALRGFDLGPLVKRLNKIQADLAKVQRIEGSLTVVANNTGVTLEYGEIVVLDPVGDNSVVYAAGAGGQAPVVVIVGGAASGDVKVAHRGFGAVTVSCDGAAVVPGDAIVASATNGLGVLDNTATVRNLVGFTLESKGVGVEAIRVLV